MGQTKMSPKYAEVTLNDGISAYPTLRHLRRQQNTVSNDRNGNGKATGAFRSSAFHHTSFIRRLSGSPLAGYGNGKHQLETPNNDISRTDPYSTPSDGYRALRPPLTIPVTAAEHPDHL